MSPMVSNLLIDYQTEKRKLSHQLSMLERLRILDVLSADDDKTYSPLDLLSFENRALNALNALIGTPGAFSFLEQYKSIFQKIRVRVSQRPRAFVKKAEWAEEWAKMDAMLGVVWIPIDKAPTSG